MTEIDYERDCQAIEDQVRRIFAEWAPDPDSSDEELDAHLTARVSVAAVILLREIGAWCRPDMGIVEAATDILKAMAATNPDFMQELMEQRRDG